MVLHTFPLELKPEVTAAPLILQVRESCRGFRNSWYNLPNTSASCIQASKVLKTIDYLQSVTVTGESGGGLLLVLTKHFALWNFKARTASECLNRQTNQQALHQIFIVTQQGDII